MVCSISDMIFNSSLPHSTKTFITSDLKNGGKCRLYNTHSVINIVVVVIISAICNVIRYSVIGIDLQGWGFHTKVTFHYANVPYMS